jgi:UDP-N-acetylglucosamine 3-dehydrogenase
MVALEGQVGDRKLRVAVVGLGGNGSSFARLYSNHPRVDLVAACDIDEGRSEFASSLGAAFVTDYHEIAALDGLDAVSVHLPDRIHADAALAAIDAGKHVFVEKPMATTIDDCNAIIDGMNRTGLCVAVGQVLRTKALYKRIKEVVDSGVLGTIYYCEGDYMVHEFSSEKGAAKVGPTYSLQGFGCSATHPLDILRWYLGNPADVMAMGNIGMAHPSHPGDGFIAALYRWPNGCIGRVTGTWACSYDHSYENAYGISLFGSEASIVRGRLVSPDGGNEPVELAPHGKGHPYDDEVEDFVDAVLGARAPATDARDGGNTAIAIICGIQAMESGETIAIPNR